MIKKLSIYVLVLATLVLFTGCETSETSETDTIDSEYRCHVVEDYKDPETGVHYLIYLDRYQGGITVRYNADGTIMVGQKARKKMVKIENDCVDCGKPCLGNDCPNRNVKRLYCDKCNFEVSVLYKYDGQELCHECLLEEFENIEE